MCTLPVPSAAALRAFSEGVRFARERCRNVVLVIERREHRRCSVLARRECVRGNEKKKKKGWPMYKFNANIKRRNIWCVKCGTKIERGHATRFKLRIT